MYVIAAPKGSVPNWVLPLFSRPRLSTSLDVGSSHDFPNPSIGPPFADPQFSFPTMLNSLDAVAKFSQSRVLRSSLSPVLSLAVPSRCSLQSSSPPILAGQLLKLVPFSSSLFHGRTVVSLHFLASDDVSPLRPSFFWLLRAPLFLSCTLCCFAFPLVSTRTTEFPVVPRD